MIKSLIATCLLLAPTVALAQVVELSQRRLEIIGTSRPACVIRTPSPVVGSNMVFTSIGGALGEVEIPLFVDSDARSRGASIDIVLPVVCNAPHRVSLRSENGALRRVGPPAASGPFVETVPYEFGAFWANQQAVGRSQAGSLSIDSVSARVGEVGVRISVAAGGPPLVAGEYRDRIVVELQAAN